jgi:serine/threonine protein kinase
LKLKEHVLGKGAHGPIRLAEDGLGTKLAVKTLLKDGLQGHLITEEDIHFTVNHPHIARLEHVYESEDKVHLVMEHMAGGELYARMVKQGRMSEMEAGSCISQTLLAISYLHDTHIVHRDIKAENLMFKDTACTRLKVIDFGLATRWDGQHHLTQVCGTHCYMAPEIWSKWYTDKVDIWAIGILTYELLTAESAYPVTGGKSKFKMFQTGQVRFGSHFKALSESAQDFVRSCLSLNVSLRPEAASALEHPWLKSCEPSDEIYSMLLRALDVASI